MRPFERPIKKNGPNMLNIYCGKEIYRKREIKVPEKLAKILKYSIFRSENEFIRIGLKKLPIIKPDVIIIRSKEL